MKTSLAHLPQAKQDELREITRAVREVLPETQAIILFGSYARGTYVELDERRDFGTPTVYRSDYDIQVVTKGVKYFEVSRRLEKAQWNKSITPTRFIHDDIVIFLESLYYNRYFYADMVKEGILLYLAEDMDTPSSRCDLTTTEILHEAQMFYDEKFPKAANFLTIAKNTHSIKMYNEAAFLLHQSTENAFRCINLVHTLYSGKTHDLEELYIEADRHGAALETIFPRDTQENIDLFELLRKAYIEARYNPAFVVTTEELDILTERVTLLRDTTQRICTARLEYYKNKLAQ